MPGWAVWVGRSLCRAVGVAVRWVVGEVLPGAVCRVSGRAGSAGCSACGAMGVVARWMAGEGVLGVAC
ncbi:hypothetical protein AB0G73_09980 [Streptomyces sp. NPDC020719]|uniref:hypothetical protein n=1 Tax=Streptomyces sp. NPDC020719 TaxID=3154896 RepID=UPI0033F21E19